MVFEDEGRTAQHPRPGPRRRVPYGTRRASLRYCPRLRGGARRPRPDPLHARLRRGSSGARDRAGADHVHPRGRRSARGGSGGDARARPAGTRDPRRTSCRSDSGDQRRVQPGRADCGKQSVQPRGPVVAGVRCPGGLERRQHRSRACHARHPGPAERDHRTGRGEPCVDRDGVEDRTQRAVGRAHRPRTSGDARPRRGQGRRSGDAADLGQRRWVRSGDRQATRLVPAQRRRPRRRAGGPARAPRAAQVHRQERGGDDRRPAQPDRRPSLVVRVPGVAGRTRPAQRTGGPC